MPGKAPIYKLSRRKSPKTQQIFYYRHATKTSELLLWHDMSADFISHYNFANLGSFAKVSVSVEFIISCYNILQPWRCGTLLSTPPNGVALIVRRDNSTQHSLLF